MLTGSDLVCTKTIPEGKKVVLDNNGISFTRDDIISPNISIPERELRDYVKVVSQIGLKDVWMGQKPGSHNRWEHSVGAQTIAQIWVKVLFDDNRIPIHLTKTPYPDYATSSMLLGYSLLLHDYGHLFFSHLLEEALSGINWVPKLPGVQSLEYRVLNDRLSPSGSLAQAIRPSLALSNFTEDEALNAIKNLIYGWSGMPWLQMMVNSPIDADKIDYLRGDGSFLNRIGYPVCTRLHFGPTSGDTCKLPWLDQFLAEQYVNHAGYLCLPGRSAIAAADLWRERIFLYDRFYLAPAIRSAERIALEIIQGFLIRWVMSRPFLTSVSMDARVADAFTVAPPVDLMENIAAIDNKERVLDTVVAKYKAVVSLLTTLASKFGQKEDRDWECFEFMQDALLSKADLDSQYRKSLRTACEALKELKEGHNSTQIEEFAKHAIVRQPIQFPGNQGLEVTNLIRPLQHQFGNEVLIDIITIPQVINIPGMPGDGLVRSKSHKRFSNLLVPRGNVEDWQPGSVELVPLKKEQLKAIERPFGRFMVIALNQSNKTRNYYIFDRIISELRQKRIYMQEVPIWPA